MSSIKSTRYYQRNTNIHRLYNPMHFRNAAHDKEMLMILLLLKIYYDTNLWHHFYFHSAALLLYTILLPNAIFTKPINVRKELE